ncbi:hypothetical protein LX97_02260 [Nonlabens dokdonensis]|jgi:hypothetical protein|uniref:Uncharacterized protein n=2 Tax=Nonlabens dokdonensis TaxID=328515 RepID=L7WBQ3_NONDD|nr:hypothetical protein [Nonlabens dokdonensis]AGC77544.1 hypothetical protein DDD_2417 [Nonlabens dokdonensis DSW-6]PZX39902.1 hypothetical protein LX97_02260 [Nonlabens dokdonensis]
METLSDYKDWIYIGGVLLAFVVFLFWNRSKQGSIKDRKRRNFKQRIQEKREERK